MLDTHQRESRLRAHTDRYARYARWAGLAVGVVAAPLWAIEETTLSHSCFVAARGKREESWFQYEFHMPGDKSKPVHVSVLCFHLPKQ